MCGIFGSIDVNITKEKLDYCCDTLAHRGPDGRGTWSYNNVNLAHRRLAIIDLSDNGKQPMSYQNGRYWITFNGEIYNYREIKKELQNKGYSFVSDSDTEVLLAAFACWGKECVKKFNGMWAFAIYDKESNELFLSRDRYGIKPLYYSYIDGGLVFASEMKAIMPCLKKPEINHSMINYFRVLHHYEFKKECLVKNIYRFPAGNNAIYKNGKLKIEKYWDTLDNLIDVPEKYEEQVEMFRELFLDACRIRMRSDVTVGTALSGGLDSSAIICAMNAVSKGNDKDYQKDWQHAYIAGFNHSVLDETVFAKKVTDHIGIANTYINVDGEIDEHKLLNQTYLFEELWMNSQIPQLAIYEAERNDGTYVSIDGHGADELFAGYEFNMQFDLLDAEEQKELDEIAYSIFSANDKGEEFNKEWLDKKLKKATKRFRYEDIYRAVFLRSSYLKNPIYKNMSHLQKSLYMEVHDKVLPTMLRNYDRDSMANGVEIRMPFMDYRLVEFAFSIERKSKMRNGYSKAIVRDALQEYMPYDIAYRKDKKGFNAPLNEWMRARKEVYLDQISSKEFMSSSIVKNPKKLKEDVEDFMNNPNKEYQRDLINAQKLWMEMNMYTWEEAFFKGKGADRAQA